jgi:hypothetical protein
MWIKKGLVYKTNGAFDWSRTHTQVPVADVLSDRIRVYYATRNDQGKSNISFVEVCKDDPTKILYEHNATLLDFGNLGAFDDSGLMPSSIVNHDGKKFLYYVGWTTRQTVPYQNAVGLAISSDDGLTFERVSEGPIISINHIEPYFSGTSFVMKDRGKFRMWYLSCIGWKVFSGKPEPLYNIKYAESGDGVTWNQTGKVAIDLTDDEGGLVSAAVIQTPDIYKMWFGKRKRVDFRENVLNSYRIGYAESKDGIEWVRKDDFAGIEPSADGWDSQMISYPYVVQVESRLLLFYNGNGFGQSGFGLAIWN